MGNTKKLSKIKMSQNTIDSINEELDYQSTLQGSGRADAREHGVEGQLVTLQVYLQEAMVAWTKNAGDEATCDVIRKVAAIAVRALETYGCPKRESK